MGVIKSLKRPRNHADVLQAFRFWLLDNFNCGMCEEGPTRKGGGVEFTLDFGNEQFTYIVAADGQEAALEAILTPDEFQAVMKMRKGAGRA